MPGKLELLWTTAQASWAQPRQKFHERRPGPQRPRVPIGDMFGSRHNQCIISVVCRASQASRLPSGPYTTEHLHNLQHG